MYKRLWYQAADNSIINAEREDGSILVIEPIMGEIWDVAKSGALGEVAAYVPPPEPTAEEMLQAERASMSATAVQFGIALIEADMLEIAEVAIAQNPSAKMIWDKSPFVVRRGAFLSALLSAISDEQVDDLFRAAAKVRV